MGFYKNIQDERDTDLPRELKVLSTISTSKKYKSKTENWLATRLLMHRRTRGMKKNGC